MSLSARCKAATRGPAALASTPSSHHRSSRNSRPCARGASRGAGPACRSVDGRGPRRATVARADFTVDGMMPTTPQAWARVLNTLKEEGVSMAKPQEVAFLQEKGAALVDVRTPAQFEQGFIKDFQNVPLFKPIEGWSAFKVGRRLGFAFFGVFNGTEPNETFLEELAAAAADKEAGVVLCCNLGGTLDPEAIGGTIGIQSRSLLAAYELVKAGYKNIRVLNNGVDGWKREGRELWMMEAASTSE